MTDMDGGGDPGPSGGREPAGHRRSGPANGAPRAVLVVALVAAAALLLSARDGLEWKRLADPLDVRWARVVVGTVIVLLLMAATRGVLRRLRRSRSRPAVNDGRAELEGEPMSVLLRLLAVVLVLGTLAVAWWVIGAVAPGVPDTVAPPSTDDLRPDPSLPRLGPDWPTLLLIGAVLVAVAVVTRLRAIRGGIDGDGERGQGDIGDATGPDAGELVSAVAAGQAELTGHQDPRAAILAAYAAMAARIESDLAAGGRPASAADTPTELLTRAGAAGLVDGTAAGTLTALFREARFSRHPMSEAHRRGAEQALATVRNELEARRA